MTGAAIATNTHPSSRNGFARSSTVPKGRFPQWILSALIVLVFCLAPQTARAAVQIMGTTGCNWYTDVNGAQCVLTSSLDGTGTSNDPIPLVTNTGLIGDLNNWLTVNNKPERIDASSYVGIEAIGGRGRNGNSCGDCSSGNGAGGGYAITVQTLGGMQQLISQYGGYVNQTTPPLLFVFVGDEGKEANTDKGGGGGAASFVTGVHPASAITESEVLFPSAQTNASSNTHGVDDLFFVIGGGGGAGGGARSDGSGGHGGDGGRMNDTGPVVAGDVTVPGEAGSSGGGHHGQGGSSAGEGIGGAAGGSGNSGGSGVGGEGGLGAGFIGTDFDWPYGLGGPIGGGEGLGGAGGGGWGGGGGGGQNNDQGGGGGGGGTWARQSASDAVLLPTLFYLNGPDFSVGDVGFSQIVISFSTVPLSEPEPVPEPSSLSLLLVGFIGLGAMRFALDPRGA